MKFLPQILLILLYTTLDILVEGFWGDIAKKWSGLSGLGPVLALPVLLLLIVAVTWIVEHRPHASVHPPRSRTSQFALMYMPLLAGITFYFLAADPWQFSLLPEAYQSYTNTIYGVSLLLVLIGVLLPAATAMRQLWRPGSSGRDGSPTLQDLGWDRRGFRQDLLERLSNDVAVRLNTTLYDEVAISLQMESRAAQVRPQMRGTALGPRPNLRWPNSTSIVDIYQHDAVRFKLLLLGEPGAGKTTTLLQLADYLLLAAKDESSEPIPIIFECSTWNGADLVDWMADELYKLYRIQLEMGRLLVQERALVLLLDGLDELRADHQADFVAKLNRFQEQQSHLVICSRREEYEQLDKQLTLNGAVYLELLEDGLIDSHLEQLGCLELRDLLRQGKGLRDLARTPLFLNMMVLCRDKMVSNADAIPEIPEAYQPHLFNTYISQKFKIDLPISEAAAAAQRLRWLSWLANLMKGRSESEFFVESLQPSNLNDTRLFGLAVGLTGGLAFGLAVGLTGGLAGGLAGGLEESDIDPVELVRFPRLAYQEDWSVFLKGLAVGLTVGLAGGLAVGLNNLKQAIQKRTQPNQGIQRSAVNGILFGASVSILLLIVGNWVLGYNILLLLPFLSLLLFYQFGGEMYIKHYALRYALARQNDVPFPYVRFLNDMAEKRILQRVGGSYRFLHNLMLEHFADEKWKVPNS